MNAEQDQIAHVLKQVASDRAAARRAVEGGPPVDAEQWRQLIELGIPGLALPEEWGGAGLGIAEQVTVAETLGYVAAPVPFIATSLAAQVLKAGASPIARALGEKLLSGTLLGVCLSAERGVPQGLSIVQESPEAARARLSGEIPDALDAAGLEILLVAAGGKWWAMAADDPGVQRKQVPSLDGGRRLASIVFADASVQLVSEVDPQRIVALAWLLLAAEATGLGQAGLDLAREYALVRQQFGQPIGRFQATKHKLTDALIAVEGARSAVHGGVRSVVDGFPAERAARMAKAVAAGAASRVVAEAIQIHGAMGNTWDLDLHLLFRRAKTCELALGAPDFHLQVLSEKLLGEGGGSRQAPALKKSTAEQVVDFALDEPDREFIAEFRAWLDKNVTPELLTSFRNRDAEQKRRAQRDWQAKMADAGWVGIHWPKAYNGRAASFTQQVLYHTEIAVRNLPRLIGNRGLSQIGPTIIAHGTEAQKKKFVEATRRADILWASGFSERGSGSDLASLRTRAVIDGDEIVINGHKIWTTSAHFSDYIYCLVRTGPLVPKHAGISCVVVPANSKGLTIQPIRRITGIADFNECLFDDVRVPRENMIGQMNNGWRVMRTTLSHEHMTNFLGAQFKQAGTVDRVIERLRRREAEGAAVDHGLRKRVAQAWVNSQLLGLHGLRNVVKLAAGQEPGAGGSILKLFGQEEEKRLWELAVDVMGPQGLVWDKWALGFLSARGSTVGGGTSEIHRNKVAERVLGMPRDLWADDDESAAGGDDDE